MTTAQIAQELAAGNASENTAANTPAQSAPPAANTPAPVVLTKQEQLRKDLESAPSDEHGNRIAVVTKVGDAFAASFAGHVIASCKRAEDLAGLLIDHRYTQKAKWAGVTELKFECDVPEGTPFKAGMSKKGGKMKVLAATLIAKIDALNLADEAAMKKITKDHLATALSEIQAELSGAITK